MRIKNLIVVLIVAIVMFLLFTEKVYAVKENDEFFTYGAGLSESQLGETKRLLEIEDRNIVEVLVDEESYNKYTGLTTKNSSLYSSAVIIKKHNGGGVNVYINTPGNITKIKDHQYMNAALTSGITDVDIIVASPVQVSGESALAGVYQALDESGIEVNTEAAKVANEELTMIKEVVEDNDDIEGFDSKELSLAIAEIKEKIAEIEDKDSISKEDINNIINDVLEKRELHLTQESKDKIASWLDKFKGLDIDWDKLGSQLKGLGNKITDKAGDLYDWGKESGFFSKIWEAIKAFFSKPFE